MPIRRVFADIGKLTEGAETLVLDADAAAGATSITVQSIVGAAINNLLLFRGIGSERSEIIATHASTAPSGNTVTLVAAGLVEAHPAGTVIYIVRWNQVRFYNAATEVDANSDDSTLTALAAAQDIDPSLHQNFYDDTVSSSGFYYYRLSDSINTVNDLYSDPIPWAAQHVVFADDEVGYILEFVRKKLSHNWGDKFSKQDAMNEISACLRFIQGKLKRWSRYLVADYALGQTARGVFDYALPSNIYDNETNKSILQVRLGGQTRVLVPKDEKEFDNLMGDVKRTTVRVLAVVGATTLDIVNSYDFDATGSVHCFTSNTDDTITYTGVTRSATAGVLTGISATGDSAITAAHAVGVNVWQDHSEGQPKYFNVRQGRLRIWPLPNSTYVNFNVFIDYNTVAIVIDSESDSIDVARYDAVVEWLLWKGKSWWRNNGKDDPQDANFLMFNQILKDSLRTEISGQKHKMKPKINTIDYRGTARDRRFDYT